MWHKDSFSKDFIETLDKEIIAWFHAQVQIPTLLKSSMSYSVCNGGKRLRPALMAACGQIFNLSFKQILPPSIAVEFIHAYSLTHDDLPAMDNSETRRGHPSCWVKYGDALAILTGDALFTSAFEIINDSSLNLEHKSQLIKYLSKCSGASGMVAGQVLDIEQEKDLAKLEELAFLKTGKLLQFCCIAPAILADSCEFFPPLEQLGKNLGLIYQITDDLLDQFGEAEITGKPSKQDINKITFTNLLGQEKAHEMIAFLQQNCFHILEKLPAKTQPLKGLIEWLSNRKS